MTKARDLANSAAAFASVSATELGYVDGVTSAIQTQLDAKAPSSTAATLSGTQTLTNKTIDTASNTITGTVTLTGTQTLTNKTLTSPVIASVVNNTLTSTTGDIIYASAANTPARLGIGSSAQVLTVASGIPSWAPPASAVVPILTTAQPTGDFSTASTSFVDITNVTITRTPSSATNKIEVKFSFVCTVSTGLQLDLKCLAGATSLLQFSYEVEYNGGSPDTINAIWYATNVAASSTIFKVQAKVNTGTITFNGTNSGYANGFSTLEVY